MPVLAINGGEKTRTKPFPAHNTIGREDWEAVEKVVQKGKLSQFLGCWHEDFFGGEQVQALEKEWASYFGVKHAISVNSATSGLYCAVGASGAGPGDEIIVSPYTMSASATAALIFNSVPVFADIEENYFCLDPKSVEEKITERTKAIIIVDLFGQPYDADAIKKVAAENDLVVIEDAAQAPGAKYRGKYAGTLGDMGVFSLNYHKHIHTGEGGIITTNDDELADKLRLIRNHAEVVLEDKGYTSLVNMIGYNFRMTEIEASIARTQLKKLEGLLSARLRNMEYLTRGFKEIECLENAPVRESCVHSYYVSALKFKKQKARTTREKYVQAINSELPAFELRETEGGTVSYGYVKPIYLQPIYQNLVGYGTVGCPFKCPFYKGNLQYSKGTCPVCERMHEEELITHEYMVPSMKPEDLDDVIAAFAKVWKHQEELI